MFSARKKLKNFGVLGINKRNADYTLRHNSRHLYPLVDDKLLTKELAEKAGVAVPELYAVVDSFGQLEELPAILEAHSDFVLKPARGSGGQGIVVVSGRMKSMYRKISGSALTWDELRYHIMNVLSGMFSLGGQTDRALIEYRVQFDPVFEHISYLGVPDVRIIVFLGVPVMAMIRLPTRISDGKANLHQGAIGAGIDLSTGRTLTAVWRNEIISDHPDTGRDVVGVEIPHWDELLHLAAKSYELTGLGYQGVDIVLDRDLGPLILEVNARPGLNIQIANRAGLEHRLKLVEKQDWSEKSVTERVEFAKEHFKI